MRSMAWGHWVQQAGSATVSQTTDCGQSSSTSTEHYRAFDMIRAGYGGACWCPPRPPHASAAGRGAARPHLTIDFTHSAITAQEKGVNKRRQETLFQPLPLATPRLGSVRWGRGSWLTGGGWRPMLVAGLLLAAGSRLLLLLLLPGYPPRWRHPLQ